MTRSASAIARATGIVLLLLLSPWAQGIVVSTGEQFVSAVLEERDLIEISGRIEFLQSFADTDSALPKIEDSEVTVVGYPGASLVAAARGFRLVEVGLGGKLELVSLSIEGFSAETGGAINVDEGALSVRGVRFTDNHSLLSGGAINVRQPESILEVLDSSFQDNTAGRRGGAISVHGLNEGIVVARSLFESNEAVFGCALSLVDTYLGRISNSYFSGFCGSALVDLDTSNPGPEFFNNTWLSKGSLAYRFRPHGDLGSGRSVFEGNVLVQAGIGPLLCQAVTAGDGIESLGENVSTDESCDLDHETDVIEPDPWQILADLDGPALSDFSPALEVRRIPTVAISNSPWRCDIADANGLGRPQDADGDGWPDCDLGAVETMNGEPLGAGHSGAVLPSPGRKTRRACIPVVVWARVKAGAVPRLIARPTSGTRFCPGSTLRPFPTIRALRLH